MRLFCILFLKFFIIWTKKIFSSQTIHKMTACVLILKFYIAAKQFLKWECIVIHKFYNLNSKIFSSKTILKWVHINLVSNIINSPSFLDRLIGGNETDIDVLSPLIYSISFSSRCFNPGLMSNNHNYFLYELVCFTWN